MGWYRRNAERGEWLPGCGAAPPVESIDDGDGERVSEVVYLRPNLLHTESTCWYIYFLFFCFRGGVTGLPVLMPPYTYFCFFSAGFKICGGKQPSALLIGRGRGIGKGIASDGVPRAFCT